MSRQILPMPSFGSATVESFNDLRGCVPSSGQSRVFPEKRAYGGIAYSDSGTGGSDADHLDDLLSSISDGIVLTSSSSNYKTVGGIIYVLLGGTEDINEATDQARAFCEDWYDPGLPLHLHKHLVGGGSWVNSMLVISLAEKPVSSVQTPDHATLMIACAPSA